MKQDWKNKPASALTQGVKQYISNLDEPTKAALQSAGINHISKYVQSTLKNLKMGEQKDMQESMMKRLIGAVQDKLSKEGGAAGFADLQKAVKTIGVNLTSNQLKDMLKDMPGVKQHRDGDYILEADLTKSQIKMVHKTADKMPKKDFMKRYGKDGDAVRYATATNMVKKKLGIAEMTKQKIKKGEIEMQEQSYKDKFNATMKDFGIKSLGDLKTDDEKKKFFKAVDAKHVAKNEMKKMNAMKHMDSKDEMKKMNAMKMKEDEVAPEPMKKLNVGDKKEMKKMNAMKHMAKEEAEPLTRDTMSLADKDPINAMKMNAMKMPIRSMKHMTAMKHMNAGYHEGMHKEMMRKMEMMKAETDPEKMEMMKKEIMMNMKNMDPMMKKEMMKKMEMAMKEYGTMMAMKHKMKEEKTEEGFASDAQRRAAFASGYKEKGKKKDEMSHAMKKKDEMSHAMKKKDENVNIDKDEMMMKAMKMNAMRMPIRSMKHMNAMKMSEPMKKLDNPDTDTKTDMSKVKDKPQMLKAMKHMKAAYHKEKYMPTKEGSIQETVAKMQMKENEIVDIKEEDMAKMIADYLKKGGTIKKLPPALAKGMKPSEMKPHEVGKMGVVKSMKMKEVREFVDTYNKHFLLNYKAEELIIKNEIQ
jgi:hypothetical protein